MLQSDPNLPGQHCQAAPQGNLEMQVSQFLVDLGLHMPETAHAESLHCSAPSAGEVSVDHSGNEPISKLHVLSTLREQGGPRPTIVHVNKLVGVTRGEHAARSWS